MMLVKVIELVLLAYIAVCGAVIFDKVKEISEDVTSIVRWRASDVADQLIKDGYITTKTGRKKAKV